MLKIIRDNTKKTTYIEFPNINDIMTSDGVLLDKNIYTNMSEHEYTLFAKDNKKYNFAQSRIKGIPIALNNDFAKITKIDNDFEKKTQNNAPFFENSNKSLSDDEKRRRVEKAKETRKRHKLEKQRLIENALEQEREFYKPLNVSSIVTDDEKNALLEPYEDTIDEKNTKDCVNNIECEIKLNNIIDKFKSMIKSINFASLSFILIVIVCSILSVYYTGDYMSKKIGKIFGFGLSMSMYLYGLFATVSSDDMFKMHKYLLGIALKTTGLICIIFSMFTSFITNGNALYKNIAEKTSVEISNTVNENKYNRIVNEIDEINNQIKMYNDDITFQQTQNTPDYGMNETTGKWDKIVSYSLTKSAKEAIAFDKENINKLNEQKNELNKQLLELENNNVTSNSNQLSKINSFLDLISSKFKLDGDLFEMILLILPSVFIDAISPLALAYYKYKNQ